MKNDLREFDDWSTWVLKTCYPNPDRLGCPSQEFLRGLARHEISVEKTEAWLEHLGTCSECFHDYTRFSAVEQKRRRWVIALGSVAAVLLCAVFAGQILLHRGSVPVGRHSVPADNTVIISTKPAILAALHLENYSVVRGEDQGNENKTLEIARAVLKLSIYLPLGSESGRYEVRLLRKKGDLKSLADVTGLAVIEDGITVLRTDADFSTVPAGKYVLSVRRKNGGWRYYPVALTNSST